MDKTPLVSVVTTFLNEERFIEEAIASVFAQTYEHWELLLVDDGSTDGSTDIARSSAAEYPGRVRYLEHHDHQNRGASASRNLGIRHARGDYIALLDGDDIFLPHKLNDQVAILNAQPETAMVYGETLYWHSWSGNREDQGRDYIPKQGFKTDTLVAPPKLIPLYLLGKAAVPCTCSILIRRKSMERSGGFEESFRSVIDDQVFYAKICLQEAVFVTNTCWDQYRQHPASSCSTAESEGRTRALRSTFLNWLEGYMQQQEIEDGEVWRALRNAQWQTRHPALARLLRSKQRLLRVINDQVIHHENRRNPRSSA